MRYRSRTRSGCGQGSGRGRRPRPAAVRPRGADAAQAQQRGAGGGDEGLELFVRGLLAGVDPFEVCDELGRDPLTGLAHRVARSDPGEQDLGLGGGEVLLRATGQHFQQDPVIWLTLRVCSSPIERRRSTSSCSTSSWVSETTGRSPAIRVPTSATECASVASVLRPCPVANTRARADSLAGTSTMS